MKTARFQQNLWYVGHNCTFFICTVINTLLAVTAMKTKYWNNRCGTRSSNHFVNYDIKNNEMSFQK